ncbi:MAG: DUF2461 domain-containing protein [Bacteroidota bacterium]
MPAPPLDLPPFPGFRDEGLQFLRDLADHNERDWFKPRKQTFVDECQWPLRCLIADCTRQAVHRGLPLGGDAKTSVFRIYRDTRFSKNKNPYKTHVSAVLSRSGGKKEPGSVYVHVEPGKSFLAAGYWFPERDLLRAWRDRLAHDPASFLNIVRQIEDAGLALSTRESLKRMPRGYNDYADSEVATYLRWKGAIVTRDVADADVQTPAFTTAVLDFAEASLPLLTFGWDLLAEMNPMPER